MNQVEVWVFLPWHPVITAAIIVIAVPFFVYWSIKFVASLVNPGGGS